MDVTREAPDDLFSSTTTTTTGPSPNGSDELEKCIHTLFAAINGGDRAELQLLLQKSDQTVMLQALLTAQYNNEPDDPHLSYSDTKIIAPLNGSLLEKQVYSHETESEQAAQELLGPALSPLSLLHISLLLGDEDMALDILDYVYGRTCPYGQRILWAGFVGQVWGDGNTALHLASFFGMSTVVQRLLEYGSNANKRNGRGYKPVDCADDDTTRALFRNIHIVRKPPVDALPSRPHTAEETRQSHPGHSRTISNSPGKYQFNFLGEDVTLRCGYPHMVTNMVKIPSEGTINQQINEARLQVANAQPKLSNQSLKSHRSESESISGSTALPLNDREWPSQEMLTLAQQQQGTGNLADSFSSISLNNSQKSPRGVLKKHSLSSSCAPSPTVSVRDTRHAVPNKKARIRVTWDPNCLWLDYAKNGELGRLESLVNDFGLDTTTPGEPFPPETDQLSRGSSWSSSLNLGYSINANYHHPSTGVTALHMACAYGHEEVVRFLVEKCNVLVNVFDKEGWTPLHSICAEIPPALGKTLTPANISASTVASQKRKRERFLGVLKYLVSLPTINVHATNNEGETASDLLQDANDDQVLAIIEEAASPNKNPKLGDLKKSREREAHNVSMKPLPQQNTPTGSAQ